MLKQKHPPDQGECLLLQMTHARAGSQDCTDCCEDSTLALRWCSGEQGSEDDNAQIVFSLVGHSCLVVWVEHESYESYELFLAKER